MAAFMARSLCRQGRHITRNLPLFQSSRVGILPSVKQVIQISTSKKDKNVGTAIEPVEESEEFKKLKKHFEDTDEMNEENYVSYGFDPADRDNDYFVNHNNQFWMISVTVCGVFFLGIYLPTFKNRDWCKREAHLLLEQREREGLPLISCDYVDPALIKLPAEEEIGDQEIII